MGLAFRLQFSLRLKGLCRFSTVANNYPPIDPQVSVVIIVANGRYSSSQSSEGEIRQANTEANLLEELASFLHYLFYSTQITVPSPLCRAA